MVGRFISKDPIGYAGGLNLYVYAPNPVFWIDPFGLARVKNAVEGERRYQLLNEQLRAKHPEATIQCECYLRDANGKSVRDPVTGEGGLKEQVQQLVKKSERANSEIERDAASEASRSFGV